jgi:hypothetical protein
MIGSSRCYLDDEALIRSETMTTGAEAVLETAARTEQRATADLAADHVGHRRPSF